MQKLIFFLDDSGSLTNKSDDRYFVYGGMYFLSTEEKNEASKKLYEIKRTTKFIGDELKFSRITLREDKLKVAKRIGSVVNSCSVTVCIPKLHRVDFDDSHSVGRYKDYMLKTLVKKVIKDLIDEEKLNPSLEIDIELFIDQQPTRTNGYYELKQSIEKELNFGMQSGPYFHPPIWRSKLKISKIKYCKSHNHFLMQASDIIAGYVRMSCIENSQFNKLKRHKHSQLP